MVESLRRALFRMRTREGEIDLSIKENGTVLSQQTEPSILDGAGRLEELKASGKAPFPTFSLFTARATGPHGQKRQKRGVGFIATADPTLESAALVFHRLQFESR